jgi:type IVB pilus formation R64 PilN family outer membrane protein
MTFKYKMRTILLAGSFIALTGCSLATEGQSERTAMATSQDVSRYQADAVSPLPPASDAAVTVNEGLWMGSQSHQSQHGLPLPYGVEEGAGITIRQSQPLNLQQIAAAITSYSGIPVTLAPDLTAKGSAESRATPDTATSGNLSATLTSLGVNADSTVAGNTSNIVDGNYVSSLANNSVMPINYSGPLSRLMDQIAGNFDDAWSYNGSAITISKNVVAVYTVHALASSIDLSTTLSTTAINESSSSGGGGGSSTSNGATGTSDQDAKSKISIQIWSDIQAGLKNIVGSNGSVAALPSTGTVTITAPPSVAAQVEGFMNEENKRLSNEVAVTVEVLNIQLQNADNFQFNLQAALGTGTSGTPLTFGNGAAGSTSGAGNLAFSIAKGPLAGTAGAVSALSTLGRVSVVTTGTVTTESGVPAPLQVTNTRGYLASVSTQSIPDGTTNTSQTTLTPGTVTTGFNLDVLPLVNYNTRSVLLQYSINIASLNGASNGFDTFSSNGQTIELPNVNERNFIQQADIPNGNTLVLTGYGQTSDTANKTGTGVPDFDLLGGGQTGTHEQDGIVILITPVVLNTGSPLITKD